MAVDTGEVKKNIFDIMKMFGPASTGGPNYNVNPGQGMGPPQGQAVTPPDEPPQPQGPPAGTMQGGPAPAPAPAGTAILPPSTPVTPNGPQAAAALNPGEADPNLLPQEVRDSPLFRYMRAQKAAEYAQAKAQNDRENMIGGLQQIVGSAFRNQGAVNASMQMGGGTPAQKGFGFDEIKSLTDQAAKDKKDAATKVALAQAEKDLTTIPGITPEMARIIIATKPEKAADLVEGRGTINDDEKERLRINKDLEANGQRAYSPLDWHMMNQRDRLAVSASQGQGQPGKGFTDRQVKETGDAIDKADIARGQMPSSLASYKKLTLGEGWTGPIAGNELVQHLAQAVGDITGMGPLQGVTDSQTLKTRAYEAVLANASKLGTQPSDADRKVIEKLVGANGELNRDALVELHRMQLRYQVAAQIRAQEQINTSRDTFRDDPRSKAYLDSVERRVGNIPDYTGEIFDSKDTAALVAFQNDPNKSPEQKKQDIANFERNFGIGMAGYVLSKRGGASAGQ